jgi:hypothetical protein
MPEPRARKRAPEREATEKNIVLTWRPPNGEDWREEPVIVTSHQITACGALMLFHRRSIIRVLAPGAWADITLIGESPLPEEEK